MSKSELCRHDLTVGTCSICKMDGRLVACITAGGLHFHPTENCANLASGQWPVASWKSRLEAALQQTSKDFTLDPCAWTDGARASCAIRMGTDHSPLRAVIALSRDGQHEMTARADGP